jgi:hypothetical protein
LYLCGVKSKAQEIVNYQINNGKTDLPTSGFYVYAITKSNIVVYIGKGKKKRVLSHFGNSSNMKLAFDYKENPTLFDYFILECFDEEIECLDFEEHLIRDCKAIKFNLYNSTHYLNELAYNKELRSYVMLLNQFDYMVFYKKYGVHSHEIFSPLERAQLVLDMIKDNFKNWKQVPKYKGKPITELKAIAFEHQDYIKIKIE